MIHSARPTISPVANIVFAWNLFCFARIWKVGMEVRTDNMCENNDHYRPWLWVGLVDQKTIFVKHTAMIFNIIGMYNLELYNDIICK